MMKHLSLMWAAAFVAAYSTFNEPTAKVEEKTKFDVSDVSYLWPIPKNQADVDALLSADSFDVTTNSALWDEAAFKQMLHIVTSDAAAITHPSGGIRRIVLLPGFSDRKTWKVVGFRVDPSAPGGHPAIVEKFGSSPQLRLILQPVTVESGKVKVHDFTAHLVYAYSTGKPHLPEFIAPAEPDTKKFKTILEDLSSLKGKLKAKGIDTQGVALGVHPGLKSDTAGPDFVADIRAMLTRHVDVKNLFAMAFMGLADSLPEPWIFVAASRQPDGSFGPAQIPALGFKAAQMFDRRDGAPGIVPTPLPTNRNSITNLANTPLGERRGVATLALFDDRIDLNAVARVEVSGAAILDPGGLKNKEIADLIANPEKTHFFSNDCFSCHSESTRRATLQLPPSETVAYKRHDGVSGVDPAMLPSQVWNVRNFGWFPDFFKGGATSPTVSQRTANEAADSVQFINNVYFALNDPAAARGDEDPKREGRPKAIEAYLARTEELVLGGASKSGVNIVRVSPYAWFSTEPAGAVGAEMIPLILQRVLPDLAKALGDRNPENPTQPLFGEPSENFSGFGFPIDTRQGAQIRPLPIGFAWTRGRATDTLPLSITVRTCAGCHTGRVRYPDDSVELLIGAPNTELLVHQYDNALATFFATHLADPTRTQLLAGAIIALVDLKHQQDPTYFFKNVPGYGADEEARQIGVFKALLTVPAEKGGVLALIGMSARQRSSGRIKLKEIAYSKPNSPDIAGGPPGFVDSSGLGIAAFVGPLKLDPAQALFHGATKNDIPSVWNQKTRKRFQWDANIRDELARNLVAALGLVGVPDKMDILGNFITSDFIDGLPPAPYPFAVDKVLAARGEVIYKANCQVCHQPDQDRAGWRAPPIFNDLRTDLNRSRVVRPLGYVAIEAALTACYQPQSLEFTYKGRWYRPNVNVDGNALFVPRFALEDQGYVAGPLDGIWARAPYLHNGSVPTLRQLLASRTRASTFVRGVISYDSKDVGWEWRADRLASMKILNHSARIYDTGQDGQAATGHDSARWIDTKGVVGEVNRAYRLGWDDPADPEVDALIEYMKTL